jgi:hypothetical protein
MRPDGQHWNQPSSSDCACTKPDSPFTAHDADGTRMRFVASAIVPRTYFLVCYSGEMRIIATPAEKEPIMNPDLRRKSDEVLTRLTHLRDSL